MSDIRIPGVTYGHGLSREARAELERALPTDELTRRADIQPGRHGEKSVRLTPEPSYRATKLAQQPGKPSAHDATEVALGTAHVALELAEHTIEKFLGRATPFVGIGLVSYETAAALPHAWQEADERHLALYRDARFIAVMLVVESTLPKEYVLKEVQKRSEVTVGNDGRQPARQIAQQLMKHESCVKLLQLRCDEGMKIAQHALAARLSQDAFFSTRPDLRARYVNDAAFRIGFDATLHANAEGKKSLDALITKLQARDARFAATLDVVFTG